ncbi:MAG: hypothetical protein GPJ54_01425 [Candidatus Heimdallarchaeota archaeon]|nr:hypothetical protein [Candidatus Heimdallarchaeota archaeon]
MVKNKNTVIQTSNQLVEMYQCRYYTDLNINYEIFYYMISKSETQLPNFPDQYSDQSSQDPPERGSLRSLTRILEYDISNLNPTTITNHKKRIYQLATFADITKIQIHFRGLEKFTKKYEMLFGCSWDSDDDYPREKEFFDLLNMIQSQSNVSSRKYDIKLVE